jgi:hypothetical protein
MKIYEVVGGYERGKEIADKISSPTKWLQGTKVDQDYQKGKQLAARALDPTKWFKGQSSDKPTASTQQAIRPKEPLVRAAQGSKLYRDDVETLKILYSQVEDKKVAVKDINQTLQTIKAAYKQQPLNDQQKNILLQLSKQF